MKDEYDFSKGKRGAVRKKPITLTPTERWEQGIDHDSRAQALAREIGRIDFEYGDALQLSFGGDGDNGEHLTYLLDIYFEEQDRCDDS